MKHILLIILLNVLAFTAHSQDLHLVSGKKSKKIPAGTFIQLTMAVDSLSADFLCKFPMGTGRFEGYENDKLKIAITEAVQPIIFKRNYEGTQTFSYSTPQTVLIYKEKIQSIKIVGKRKIKEHTTGQSLGYLLIVLGLGHISTSPIAGFDEEENGDLLLKIGLSEFIAGIAMAIIFDQKTYYLSPACEGSSDKLVWSIQ